MPYTKAQKALFGADKRRAEQGKPTRTGMSQQQLNKALHEPTKPSKPPKPGRASKGRR